MSATNIPNSVSLGIKRDSCEMLGIGSSPET